MFTGSVEVLDVQLTEINPAIYVTGTRLIHSR